MPDHDERGGAAQDAEVRAAGKRIMAREACSAWPPAGSCGRCDGMGGHYRATGPADWDWTTCRSCNGTGRSSDA